MSSTTRQLVSVARSALSIPLSSLVLLSQTDELQLQSVVDSVKYKHVSSLEGVNEVDLIVADGILMKDGMIGENGIVGGALDSFLLSAVSALRTQGVLVIREDVRGVSHPRETLPALTDYFDVFRREVEGKYVGFDFYCAEQLENSIHTKQNWLDFIWVLRKKEFPKPSSDSSAVTFRDFLDKTQYTNTGIGSYEWMFGKDFISPGGFDENLRIFSKYLTGLEVGRTMLDIGSGIGGGVRQAAASFGIYVTGTDLSANMLSEAIVRVHNERDSRVRYSICDAVLYSFPSNYFDFVFSRDCIQHIPDKHALFRNIFKSLKPGGVVLITMYGKGKGELTEEFKKFVEKRMYHLQTLEEVKKVAESEGFVNLYTENLTPRFKEILTAERDHLVKEKDDFFKHYSQAEYDSLYNGWTAKLGYIEADNHNWNLLRAQKPL